MQRLEARNHHTQQLDDDGCRDVRHDAQCENRQLQHCAAGEEVHQTNEVFGGAVHRTDALLNDLIVDAWGRNERTNTINDDDTKSEEDLVPQLLGFQGLD